MYAWDTTCSVLLRDGWHSFKLNVGSINWGYILERTQGCYRTSFAFKHILQNIHYIVMWKKRHRLSQPCGIRTEYSKCLKKGLTFSIEATLFFWTGKTLKTLLPLIQPTHFSKVWAESLCYMARFLDIIEFNKSIAVIGEHLTCSTTYIYTITFHNVLRFLAITAFS